MAPSRAGRPGCRLLMTRGGSTRWTPEAISEVHALAQLGRYQVRGYNTFNKRMPTFDDLTFVPATMTRCRWRAIARAAIPDHLVLGNGRWHGRKTVRTEDPDLHRLDVLRRAVGERQGVARLWCLQGRHHDLHGRGRHAGRRARGLAEAGLPDVAGALPSSTSIIIRRADALEIVVGQGAKPGTGGLLLGMKVSPRVSVMRTLAGRRRSALHHPPSPISSAPTICRSRSRSCASPPITRCRSSCKMGATRPRFDVAIAAKAGVDVVVVDGAEGGTGASPELLLNHTGIPDHELHPRGARSARRVRHDRQGRALSPPAASALASMLPSAWRWVPMR